MGLREDLDRFERIGEERRQDLKEFITYGDLGASDTDDVKIPIKIIDIPEFRYDRRDRGGIGQGDVEVGQPVEDESRSSDDGDDEPGTEGADHAYYEMDPEAFAAELDEELGLDLEPKGKKVIERVEGSFTDRSRAGPESTLDVKELLRRGLKRKLAIDFDERFMREILKVDGIDPDGAYGWARREAIPVSRKWLVETYEEIPVEERSTWSSIDAVEAEIGRTEMIDRIRSRGLDHIPLRREDERFRQPEIVKEYQRNVVVVNIRDVSGSMHEDKRELVERTFSPLDWYLQGKYDNAEFIYIAHDAEAWEVNREDFFGIRSGGGTRISTAYELAADRLEAYPWSEWNRFVFAAGDSENSANDTADAVIPLMESIDANRHAYVETQPDGASARGKHAETLEAHFQERDDVVVSYVNRREEITSAITDILQPAVPA